MKIKYITIELTIFIILIFLQTFSLITTNEFGIAAITIFLIFQVVWKKLYRKINVKYLILTLIIMAMIIISGYVNNVVYFSQILRLLMTIFIIYCGYIYSKTIFEDKEKTERFWKIYGSVILFFVLYGVYEFFAIKYELPLFMNVFNNNTSYAPKGVFIYYGGWSEGYRLYNTFYEPSVFGIFMAYNFFIILSNKYIKLSKKIVILGLIAFNLIFTFARSGWVTFLYMATIYIVYAAFNFKSTKFFDKILMLLPFLNLIIMTTLGLILYEDFSSQTRTYSAIYFLTESVADTRSIILGHGVGSVINTGYGIQFVEPHAHNGYIDIIYQVGWPIFLFILVQVYKIISNIKGRYKKVVVGITCSLCCFGVYYMVESIVILTVVMIVFAINEGKREELNDTVKN